MQNNLNKNNNDFLNTSSASTNTPFNYYALFLNESNKTENFYDKYFLRISEDYTENKTKYKDSSGSSVFSFFANLFSSTASSKNPKSKSDWNSIDFDPESYECDADAKFIIDKQIKFEKNRRLGESDSLYKIKKHHQNNLNEHYRKLTKSEKSELEKETAKELEYLRLCRGAESKLKQNKQNAISLKELNALIKRNYTLFTNEQKNDLSKINNFYYSLILANLLGVSILTSFCRSIFKFFCLFSNKFLIRNLILTAYFSFTVTNNTLYINEHIRKKLVYYPNKIKERILDKENERLKVPYDANMHTYNADEENKHVFNFI